MIDDALYSIITGNTTVAAVLGTRLYPNQGPPNPTEPYATYSAIADDTLVHLTGPSGLGWVEYQIDVWAKDTRDAKDAAEKIRLALVDYTGTTAGETVVDVICGPRNDSFTDEGIGANKSIGRVSRDYRLWYEQATP